MRIHAEHHEILENAFFRNFPTQIPYEYLESYSSILKNKKLIKYAEPDLNILISVLDVVIELLKLKTRFQKLTLLRLIKHHLPSTNIQFETTEKLFFIFQELIIGASEELGWKLTMLIKDIQLSNEQIDWLIANYSDSLHIVNRLLRYPKPDKSITKWAKERLKQNDLNERLSELIALQLNFNKNFKHKNSLAYVWGIHYSKLDDKVKKDLLLRATTNKTIIDIVAICERNNYLDIIALYYSVITGQLNGIDLE